ncbi:MAG: T9SS type A sorting domain-containing protein, partial [Sphingobacteriales bacterium]
VRWNQPLKSNTTLDLLRSGNWETIDVVPPGSKNFAFNLSIVPGAYQFRIKSGDNYLLTDSFTISDPPRMGVGYLCPDSTMLFWNASPADNYQIKHLPGNYLSDLVTVQDTIFVTASSPGYFSVAEIYSGLEGLRSLTINPALQGTGCYIKNFLADLVDNEGKLTLQLATGTGISTIKLQKLTGNIWTTIDSSVVGNLLNFSWNDPAIFRGTNYYRVELTIGTRKVYSSVESLFFFNSDEVILYPNPIVSGSSLRIATADTEELLIELFDGIGRKIFSYGPVETIEQVPTEKLRSGVFFYRITRKGKMIGSGRLVVR